MTDERPTPTPKRARAGRRPGRPDTRAAIVEAARAAFAEEGFDRTSMRGVARAAGVDPALVHHYFDSKDDLFLESLGLPFDPRALVPEWTEDGLDDLGRQVITRFLQVWDDPGSRQPIETLLRSAMVSDAAADAFRTGMVRMILTPISEALGTEDGLVRAQLVASQLAGLAVTRYVVGLQPLATLPADEVARRVAPTLQRYLTGPLDDDPRAARRASP
jgi:AcrR family transcriptional regulator